MGSPATAGAIAVHIQGETVPHVAVTLMVIFGFIGCALILRAMANAEARREPVRMAQQGIRAPRAMMDE